MYALSHDLMLHSIWSCFLALFVQVAEMGALSGYACRATEESRSTYTYGRIAIEQRRYHILRNTCEEHATPMLPEFNAISIR
jgi:hypothetical protein